MDKQTGVPKKQMMIIGGVVVAILVVAAAAFFMMPKSATQSTETSMVGDQGGGTVPTQGMSIKDLLTAGGSQECTFEDIESASSGVVYMADGKMRGDFDTVNGSESVSSHMISDGSFVYVWTDDQPTGFKMAIADMDKMGENQSEANKSVDVNKKVDYSCSAWLADGSKFEIPTNVKFSDMGTMMQDAMQGVEGMEGMDSSVCEQITDAAAKAACLQAVGQ